MIDFIYTRMVPLTWTGLQQNVFSVFASVFDIIGVAGENLAKHVHRHTFEPRPM